MMMSVTRDQGGGVLLHRECCSVATVVGGTTQDLRTWRGPEGDSFQPRNPPEKESRARRYRVDARTVWQVSDVGRLYVRCQIFQWPSPWCGLTAVWPDRRMSADFTSGSQMSEQTGISTPDQETTVPLGQDKGFLSRDLGNSCQVVATKGFGTKRMVKSEGVRRGLSHCLPLRLNQV